MQISRCTLKAYWGSLTALGAAALRFRHRSNLFRGCVSVLLWFALGLGPDSRFQIQMPREQGR